MNVEIGAEAALFPEKEYINRIAVAVCTVVCRVRSYSRVRAQQVMNVWEMINQDLHGVSWWSPWWWVIIGLGPQKPKARVPALSSVFPCWIGGKDWQEVDTILYCGESCKRKTVPAALKGLLIFESSCQLQLHLRATMRNHLNRALRAGSVL